MTVISGSFDKTQVSEVLGFGFWVLGSGFRVWGLGSHVGLV